MDGYCEPSVLIDFFEWLELHDALLVSIVKSLFFLKNFFFLLLLELEWLWLEGKYAWDNYDWNGNMVEIIGIDLDFFFVFVL
jgi:hypothetical protein